MGKTFYERIEAEVVLKTGDARKDINEPDAEQSGVNLVQISEAMKRVTKELRRLGFEVVAEGSRSISIAGSKALFETHFRLGGQSDAENETLKIPDEIRAEVEGVFVQRPPTYFQE